MNNPFKSNSNHLEVELSSVNDAEHLLPAGTGAGAVRGSTGGGRRTGSTTRTDIGSGRGGREIATEKGELARFSQQLKPRAPFLICTRRTFGQ